MVWFLFLNFSHSHRCHQLTVLFSLSVFLLFRWNYLFSASSVRFLKGVTRILQTTGLCCPTVCLISVWTHYFLWVKISFSQPPVIPVCPLDSHGCIGGRHFGPTAPELSGVSGESNEERWQESGYFLDEKWSERSTERKLLCGAARGKFRRGELHLPQQWRITPESHCGPNPRGWKSEEEDSCEKWPRYGVIQGAALSLL